MSGEWGGGTCMQHRGCGIQNEKVVGCERVIGAWQGRQVHTVSLCSGLRKELELGRIGRFTRVQLGV